MAQIIHIDNLDAPELLAYAHLTEAQLRDLLERATNTNRRSE